MADFFGRKDRLWGGETIKVTQNRFRTLGIKRNDRFRIEKGPKSKLTLIPHPGNRGTWKNEHSKKNPVTLKRHRPTDVHRAFSMMVQTRANAEPRKLFLLELDNGSIAISTKATSPSGGADDNSASVEH